MRIHHGFITALALFSVACADDESPGPVSPDPNVPDGQATFELTLQNVSTMPSYVASGSFSEPEGGGEPGPLLPGESYRFEVEAAPAYPGREGDSRLYFATMFVPSNDLFLSPGPEGIDLFDDEGNPITGDVTDQVQVWDAGTEEDEPLNGDGFTSPNQQPHQAPDAQNVGPEDDDDAVRLASETYPGSIPPIEDLISLTVDAEVVEGVTRFSVIIENTSEVGLLGPGGPFQGAVPLSPGVFTMTTYDGQGGALFTPGLPSYVDGLEDLAEDGSIHALDATLMGGSGLVFVSSPGAWAVHDATLQFFTEGSPLGELGDGGLEAIAEDGNVTPFLEALSVLESVESSDALGEAPIPPGGATTATFTALLGERLSLAPMLVPSNDLLLATGPDGIELFDAGGVPRSGNVSEEIAIWNLGTEVDQALGEGLDQVHLQPGPNTGDADPNANVRRAEMPGLPDAQSAVLVTLNVVE